MSLGLLAGAAAAGCGHQELAAQASADSLGRAAFWGAYASPEPYPNCQPHYALERSVGPLGRMSWFVNWSSEFPRAAAYTGPRGYELLIAWLPVSNGGRPIAFADILNGHYDGYLSRFFQAAAEYPHSVTLRFAPEMNRNTFPWSVGGGGPKSAREFRETWSYIYRLKERGAASNVKLLWCIGADGGTVPAEEYFPGVDAVDRVGFDAYSGYFDNGWTDPAPLLQGPYRRLAQLAPAASIWCCELGCRQTRAGEHHSKAQWITDLFRVSGLPKLTHVFFFNKKKEQDWRLDSSADVLAAVRTGLAGRPPGH